MPRFDPFSHTTEGIKEKALRGGLYTGGNQLVKFLGTLVSTMVLGRLLTPDHYGVYATAMVATVFFNTFKELGLSLSTIQKTHITPGEVSDLFWVNIALSTFLSLLTLASGWLLAWFYAEPRVAGLLTLLAFNYLAGGLAIQHKALLYRAMQFREIALIEILATVVSVAVGIGAALAGATYFALGLMQLSFFVTGTLATFYFCPWIPQRKYHGTGLGDNLKMGGYYSVHMVCNYFSTNADNLLVRKMEGSEALGLYSRAYSLLMIPVNQVSTPITAVAIPALSRLQHDPVQFRQYYLKALSVVALLTMPAIAIMAALSEEIIWVLLGAQWLKVSGIFSILAVAALLRPVYSTTGWIFIALGRTREMAWWGMATAPLMVVAFVWGIYAKGVYGVAVAYSVTMVLLGWPLARLAVKNTLITLPDLARACKLPSLLSLLLFLSLYTLSAQFKESQPVWKYAIYAADVLAISGLVLGVWAPGLIRLVKQTTHDFGFWPR
jgi:PST family polysaccharide transporter